MNVTWIASRADATMVRQQIGAAKGSAGAPNLLLSDRLDQTWRGFGGCFNEMGWKMLTSLPASRREGIIRDFFAPSGGFQFTYCRMPIGANDYALSWYSHNEHDGDFAMRRFSIEHDRQWLIPYIRSALRYCPNMTLFASPWSPPTWLKDPPVYNYGKVIQQKKHLQAYALYFLKFVQAYAAEGIRIAQVHFQNEPMADQKFPSCLWTGAEMRNFMRDNLGPLFQRKSPETELWLGTLNGGGLEPQNSYNDYAGLVLNDPRTRRYIRGISYQWSGRTAIQKTHYAWPDMPLIQSENECGEGDNTWEYAFYICDLFQHYITNGVSGYIYWNMVLPPGGVSTWGWKQNAMITVDPVTGRVVRNPEYYVMKHFAGYIRPGMRRIVLEGEWAAHAVAFRGAGRTVIVAKNGFPYAAPLRVAAGGERVQCMLQPRSINTFVIA